MFGECFDFAPKPERGGRRPAQYMPAVRVEVQLTPKETANKLATTAGIDPVLLDGIPQDLLDEAKIGDVRVGMYYAVGALQQGKSETEQPKGAQSNMSLGDFLLGKIARLPLSTRFPLMAEWSAKFPAAWNNRPSAEDEAEASFLSFGEPQAASFQDPLAPLAEGRRRKPQAKDKEKKRKPQPEAYEEEEAYEGDEGDQGGEEYERWKKENAVRKRGRSRDNKQQSHKAAASSAGRSRPQLDDSIPLGSGPTDQMRKDAERREEAAKSTASKVLLTFQQTAAAVQAGQIAAKQKIATNPPPRREVQIDARDIEEKQAPADDQLLDDEHEGEGGRRTHRRRRRPRDAEGNPIDDGRRRRSDEGGGYERDHDDRRRRGEAHDDRGHRHDRDAGSRREPSARDYSPNEFDGADGDGGYDEWTRDEGSHQSRGGRSGRGADVAGDGNQEDGGSDAVIKRKRALGDLLHATKSVSPGRTGQKRKAVDAIFEAPLRQTDIHSRRVANAFLPAGEQKRGASSSAAPAAGTIAKPASAAPAEKAVPPPIERKLRQLAFKNGWAEYVEEGTGQHVFKNVFTNEMTRTKPAELQSQITDAQNQRRLAWLAGHRTAAMMADMGVPHGMMGPR